MACVCRAGEATVKVERCIHQVVDQSEGFALLSYGVLSSLSLKEEMADHLSYVLMCSRCTFVTFEGGGKDYLSYA